MSRVFGWTPNLGSMGYDVTFYDTSKAEADCIMAAARTRDIKARTVKRKRLKGRTQKYNVECCVLQNSAAFHAEVLRRFTAARELRAKARDADARHREVVCAAWVIENDGVRTCAAVEGKPGAP